MPLFKTWLKEDGLKHLLWQEFGEVTPGLNLLGESATFGLGYMTGLVAFTHMHCASCGHNQEWCVCVCVQCLGCGLGTVLHCALAQVLVQGSGLHPRT